MRPSVSTPAHTTDLLAELVCSNSLKSESPDSPTGLLKEDLARLDSLLIGAARRCRVPAGKALAVDRRAMAEEVTRAIENEPGITLIRGEVKEIPHDYGAVIVATGPLTSPAMAASLERLLGPEELYFYDAIAPIVEADSIDPSIAFVQDRYGEPGKGDHLNLPMNREEYERFVETLLAAETMAFRDFEKKYYFEGCLPIEEIAARGRDSLAFGPLKPVGLTDPATGRRPHAAIQLRKETATGEAYNMIGFQTKLTYPEQERVFRAIPGMANATFLKFGSLHRNTYINAPKTLNRDLSVKAAPNVRLAGQITGVEGYVESIATGLLAGLFTEADSAGSPIAPPPDTTALGVLIRYITDAARADDFQPTNINFSLFPPLDKRIRNKKQRRKAILDRSRRDMERWAGGVQTPAD